MPTSSEQAEMPQEDPISLYTLAGLCQNESMSAAAGMLIQAIGLQNWRGWFEPFPGPRTDGRFGRDTAFHPWTAQLPESGCTPPLAEIRIAGYLSDRSRYGGCHLVQDDELGIRWFAVAETPFEVAGQKSVAHKTVRRCYPVLQRTDATARFFIEQPEWLGNTQLQLAEYWRDERIYAWLVVDTKAQGGK